MMNEKFSNTVRCVKTNLGRIPTLTVTGETDLSGNFYLSFISVPAIMQLDGKGNAVWTSEAPLTDKPMPPNLTIPEGKEFPDSRGWWDFKKTIGTDGKTYYSYHAASEDGDNYGVSGYHPGKRVILLTDHLAPNESAPDRKELTLLPDDDYPKYGIAKDNYVDGHDFLMFTPDHYILSSYRYDANSKSVYSYLQEVENGKVVWRWSSILYDDLSDLTQDSTDTQGVTNAQEDTVHFNSMCLDVDGNLICSFRHKNTIAKISRGDNAPSGVGEIIWQLSGDNDEFRLTIDQKSNHQHFVRREISANNDSRTIPQNNVTPPKGDDCLTTLTCFDNQNENKKTRIATYIINQETKTLHEFQQRKIARKFSSACGSVQHISKGIYVIGWGKAVDKPRTAVRECMTVYDFDTDTVLMSISIDSPLGANFTYRCIYCE